METRRIDILSDSTGETAEKVVRAALLQFPHSGATSACTRACAPRTRRAPSSERAAQGRRPRGLHRRQPRAARVHPRVHELRAQGRGARPHRLAHRQARRPSSTAQPINMPSGMLPLTEEYFRRIEAVEFAVKSDDGKEPRNFREGRHRALRRQPHEQDAALHAARPTRPQGRQPAASCSASASRRSSRRRRRTASWVSTIELDQLGRDPQGAPASQLGMPMRRPATACASRSSRSSTTPPALPEAPRLARHRRHRPSHRGDGGHHPGGDEGARRADEGGAVGAGVSKPRTQYDRVCRGSDPRAASRRGSPSGLLWA